MSIISEELYLDYCDVLIKPYEGKVESRFDVDLRCKYTFKHSDFEWNGVPICAANMGTTGTIKMAKGLDNFDMMTALHKHYSQEEMLSFFSSNLYRYSGNKVFYSMGATKKDFKKLNDFVTYFNERYSDHFPCFIMIDVANGYRNSFSDFIKKVRKLCPQSVIAAGNVATPEMVKVLVEAGADIVKVGIGPGKMCQTRHMTGIGVPQLSAVIECSKAARDVGGRIMADGGIVEPGDVAKAFAAGADFVMIGTYFAGADECEGEWTDSFCPCDGPKYLKHYGMASSYAMDKYEDEVRDYRASEGSVTLIEGFGPVETRVKELLGGLRSACTYTGCPSLQEFQKGRNPSFVKVNRVRYN